MAEKIYPLICDPGIQRDGTKSASKKWTDGQWVRFQRGVPKKIGGWKRIQPQVGYYNLNQETGEYTIGQPDFPLVDLPNFTWNPYLQYQPRGMKLAHNEKVQFSVITGCVNDAKWTKISASMHSYDGSSTDPYADTTVSLKNWSMPLPLIYYNNTSGGLYPDASSSVNISLIDKDQNITPMANNFTSSSNGTIKNNLLYQNLSGIGPYVAYLDKANTQWFFETAHSVMIPALNIELDTSTSIPYYKFSNITKIPTDNIDGSNVLFGIPLYNALSIQNTFISDKFTLDLKFQQNNRPIKNYSWTYTLPIFPIVYVTSLDSMIIDSTTDKKSCIQPMYQLSHCGNPSGASSYKGPGASHSYGEDFVLPSQGVEGHAGIGNLYFPCEPIVKGLSPIENPNTINKYLWSSDSVFCSGGVLNLAPYIFFYNYHPWDWTKYQPAPSNGYIAYTYPGMEIYTTDATPQKATTPYLVKGGNGTIPYEGGTTIIQDFVQVANTNIVYGAAVRGGSNSPSALFWSLDSLIKCSYVGAPTQFQFDTIASNISILSSRCVVEVSGVFYWIGNNQFYVYNGVVETLPNDTNINFFFNNVDRNQAQRIWGTKIDKYNEIWWHWPNKNLPGYAGECNAVLIFNYTPGAECWYDHSFPVTDNLPSVGRVCGGESSIFSYPVWIDAFAQPDFTPHSTSTSNYWYMWLHEKGNDMIVPGLLATPLINETQFLFPDIIYSVSSYIESREFSLPAIGPDNNWSGVDRWLKLTRIEPNFLQTGDIQLFLKGKKYNNDYDSLISNYNPYLFLGNTSCGVCLNQMILLSGDPTIFIPMNINGTYASGEIAIFPYPRLITITNYSYFTINSLPAPCNITINITGTYQKRIRSESIIIASNMILGGYSTGISQMIYDSITNVEVIFTETPAIILQNASAILRVGTRIPYGTEKESNESQRLKNFYIDIHQQSRIFKLRLVQNTPDSFFELGQLLMHFDVGDGRQ